MWNGPVPTFRVSYDSRSLSLRFWGYLGRQFVIPPVSLPAKTLILLFFKGARLSGLKYNQEVDANDDP